MAEIGPDDSQWFYHWRRTHGDDLVAMEDAAYRRLDHAQGSILPYYYGTHKVLLRDGVWCWAILTEMVEGDTPQSLPRHYSSDMKRSAAVGLRHILKVLQYAEEAPMQASCTMVNLWRAKFSTLEGRNEPTDDYLELWQMMLLAFGEDVAIETIDDREPWDFYTWYTNTYIGDNWKPRDYDTELYERPDEEDPRMYRRGGYHPVRIGEMYDGRYRVLRKLGWGECSTVWLARDLQSSRYGALKMLQARRTAAMDEREVFDIIAKEPSAWDHIAERLGSFVHEGPYGKHPCIVSEVLGMTLRDLVKFTPKRALSTQQVKGIARQLLSALQCCHRQGIIHAGIKDSNVMIVLTEIESYLELAEVEGVPAAANSLNDAKAYYPLVSKPINTSTLDEFTVKLVGFGGAQKADRKTSLRPIHPQLLQAPEIILDAGWGAPADIWNFACLIYESYSGQLLFESLQLVEIPPVTIQLAQMQSICGSFPEDLLRRGRLSSRYFDPGSGQVEGLFISPSPLKSLLERWMKELHGANDPQVNTFKDFLRSATQLDPNSRASATELLQHPWLNS
ncbi:hypothetical protein FRC01_004777 [Tulasnella sp. 417]|nr:hypothetical protein FRC01_004777 [Tulasnella sp. 417]